jgi:hypothetical protein
MARHVGHNRVILVLRVVVSMTFNLAMRLMFLLMSGTRMHSGCSEKTSENFLLLTCCRLQRKVSRYQQPRWSCVVCQTPCIGPRSAGLTHHDNANVSTIGTAHNWQSWLLCSTSSELARRTTPKRVLWMSLGCRRVTNIPRDLRFVLTQCSIMRNERGSTS